MNLLQSFGTGVKLIDLIVPFVDNESILRMNCVSKDFVYLRKYVVERKYGDKHAICLSRKELKTVSKEIGNLKNLEELYLDNNKLTLIPPEIGNLKNLEELYLACNSLTSIPPEIGNLTKLEEFYLW